MITDCGSPATIRTVTPPTDWSERTWKRVTGTGDHLEVVNALSATGVEAGHQGPLEHPGRPARIA